MGVFIEDIFKFWWVSCVCEHWRRTTWTITQLFGWVRRWEIFQNRKKSTKKFEENKVQLYPHFFITKNSVSWSFLGQIHIYCIEPVLPQIQNWRWETVRNAQCSAMVLRIEDPVKGRIMHCSNHKTQNSARTHMHSRITPSGINNILLFFLWYSHE